MVDFLVERPLNVEGEQVSETVDMDVVEEGGFLVEADEDVEIESYAQRIAAAAALAESSAASAAESAGIAQSACTTLLTDARLARFTHDQTLPSDTWVIVHGLNRKPAVSVVDTADNIVDGSVSYDSETQLTITFSFPFSGKAYLV